MRIYSLVIIIMIMYYPFDSFSQKKNEIRISKSFKDYPFIQFVEDMEKKDETIRFYFEDSWIEKITVTGDYQDTPLEVVLKDIFKGSFISFMFFDPYTIVLFNENPLLFNSQKSEEVLSKKQLVVGDSSLFASLKDKEVLLSGTITSSNNGENLPGVIINFPDLKKSVSTNYLGSYKIAIPTGVHAMQIRSIGYEMEEFSLVLYSGGKLNYEIFEESTVLKEFTLKGEAEDENLNSTKMGVERIDIQNIKQLPTFLGEVDVVKSIQTLPGVSTVGEGSSGFNVRGGGVGQNLILLDDIPVFNTSHLFGFFSAFNSDNVKDIRLYKGSIPAKYGGRASSVLEIKQKEGNLKKVTGSGGAGLVASRFTLQAPILKDKTSLLISGRSSYVNWIIGQIRDSNVNDSKASFYDFTGKLAHTFSDKSKLVSTFYSNRDRFQFDEDTTFNWQNTNASIKYTQSFNDRLIGEFTGYISNYSYLAESNQSFNEFELSYDIKTMGGKAEFEYNAERQDYIFGGSITSYSVRPGEIEKTNEQSLIEEQFLSTERALESVVFLDMNKKLNDRIAVSAGIRGTLFQKLGAGTSYIYRVDVPMQVSNIIDSVYHSKGEVEKSYLGLSPRFSVRFILNNSSSLKFGYNRLQQFIHQVSNTAAISPLAVWKLSNTHIKPQISDAIALGYFRNFRDNAIRTSVEIYYKRISNAISYKNGAKLLLNELLETELLQGQGRAYGLELMLKKVKGRLKGQASYTYSRTELKFESEFNSERLSSGKFFPADYDRPHNFFTSLNYDLSKRFIFGANFTLTSGRPITVPTAQYFINDRVIFEYSERNQFRIPTYHRLDLSLTFLTNHRKNKFWEGSWTIALFNVYGRKNPFSVFFKSEDSQVPRAYRAAILAVPFPAITYNFKF